MKRVREDGSEIPWNDLLLSRDIIMYVLYIENVFLCRFLFCSSSLPLPLSNLPPWSIFDSFSLLSALLFSDFAEDWCARCQRDNWMSAVRVSASRRPCPREDSPWGPFAVADAQAHHPAPYTEHRLSINYHLGTPGTEEICGRPTGTSPGLHCLTFTLIRTEESTGHARIITRKTDSLIPQDRYAPITAKEKLDHLNLVF